MPSRLQNLFQLNCYCFLSYFSDNGIDWGSLSFGQAAEAEMESYPIDKVV